MTALGALLQLLHDAHDNVRTFTAEYHDWYIPAPSNKLTVQPTGSDRPTLRWDAGGPSPQPVETLRRIWLQTPDLLRVEIQQGNAVVHVAVRDRRRWWQWDLADGIADGEVTPDDAGRLSLPAMLAPPLVAPSRLLSGLRFEVAGEGTRVGRQAIRAHARPRERASRARPSPGSDEPRDARSQRFAGLSRG
jgi:hypothetical protein